MNISNVPNLRYKSPKCLQNTGQTLVYRPDMTFTVDGVKQQFLELSIILYKMHTTEPTP